VAPSLPAESWEALEHLWSAFAGTLPELQIDIVDGEFVTARSWPFTSAAGISDLERARIFAPTELEIDAMCLNPERYLDLFAEIGAKRVIIHYGSTAAYALCREHSLRHGYALGLGITNDRIAAEYEPLLASFDYVQVMGIAVIGAQGQPFDERTIETVHRLRAQSPRLEIAVDGAVNLTTGPRLKAAGANRFLPGSAISRAPDPALAYKQLCDALLG
jgi:ribulose-phosphate 3-epimerase